MNTEDRKRIKKEYKLYDALKDAYDTRVESQLLHYCSIVKSLFQNLRMFSVNQCKRNDEKYQKLYKYSAHYGLNKSKDRMLNDYVLMSKGANKNILETHQEITKQLQKIYSVADEKPSLQDIYAEAKALTKLGNFSYNLKEGTLSYRVNDISFTREHNDDLYLGDFSIVFDFFAFEEYALLAKNCISIISHHENYSATNSSVPHPHVENERMCMGDATTLVNKALEEARLTDLFDILESTLRTYNPSSPYVDIESWEGETMNCVDCGDVICEEDTIYCEHEQEHFCSNCVSLCERCHTYTACRILNSCVDCKDDVCPDCLYIDDDDFVCKGCYDDREEERERVEQEEREQEEREQEEREQEEQNEQHQEVEVVHQH